MMPESVMSAPCRPEGQHDAPAGSRPPGEGRETWGERDQRIAQEALERSGQMLAKRASRTRNARCNAGPALPLLSERGIQCDTGRVLAAFLQVSRLAHALDLLTVTVTLKVRLSPGTGTPGSPRQSCVITAVIRQDRSRRRGASWAEDAQRAQFDSWLSGNLADLEGAELHSYGNPQVASVRYLRLVTGPE
jgi:hypothetical protein